MVSQVESTDSHKVPSRAETHRLPHDMSLDYGALLEPLGVAIHALRRSQLTPGSRVLVFGAGAVGLLCGAMARISGAGKVIIADIDPGRTDFAVKHRFADASYAVPPKRGSTTEENLQIATETAKAISDVDDISEFDVCFECTGVPSCLQASIFVCNSRATRCQFANMRQGHETGWQDHADRHGNAHPNTAHFGRASTRG